MAFETIPGVKIVSKGTFQTFIIGDYFAVYEKNDTPQIYNWSDIDSVTESIDTITIETSENSYVIPKSSIPDVKTQLSVRAIIEGQIAVNPNIAYHHGKRILPEKTMYKNCDPSDNAYIATGAYAEKEINYSSVTLSVTRSAKILWAMFFIGLIAAFTFCCIFIGDIGNNILKFVAVSILFGGVLAMFVYMIRVIVARSIYARYFKHDFAASQPITFVVCEEGFAAVESDVYTYSDIIRWSDAAYFIETNYMYIIFSDQRGAIYWLPKRLFPKEIQVKLSDFIAKHLLQG